MNVATPGQLVKVLDLINQKKVPPRHLQYLLEGGYLADLFDAHEAQIDRAEFREFLDLPPIEKEMSDWKVWKTIKIGSGPRSGTNFFHALQRGGFGISEDARDMLTQRTFTVAIQETTLSLVLVSISRLGFKETMVPYEEICARALERGLQLCPPEVGPQLRLQYSEESRGMPLTIGMDPISSSRGDLNIFRLVFGNEVRWLESFSGHPKGFWPRTSRFVFCVSETA